MASAKLSYALHNFVPALAAIAVVAVMFPENSPFWTYTFVLAFNLVFFITSASFVSYLSSKQLYKTLARVFGFIGGKALIVYNECYHLLFDSALGKFFQYIIGIFIAVSTFFFARSIDIPDLLQATWDVICAIPRYLRDINMISSLIRTWLKRTGIAWILAGAKRIVELMNETSQKGEFVLVIILFVVGISILLFVAFLSQVAIRAVSDMLSAPKPDAATVRAEAASAVFERELGQHDADEEPSRKRSTRSRTIVQ